MSIAEYLSKPDGKCLGCEFYEIVRNYWLIGDCTNPRAKIRRRSRYWNDRACSQYRKSALRAESEGGE